MADTTGTTAYAYDELYRLTGVTHPNGDTQSYTYDAMGDRPSMTDSGGPTTYTYDDAGQMTLAGGVTYAYDNSGNQTPPAPTPSPGTPRTAL